MEALIDLFLHLDKHLNAVVGAYHGWTYAILFLIVFCETGLVVTPILPGDSLLFAAGAIAAVGNLDILVLILMLIVAAVLGDAVNYHLGRYIGPKVFERESRIFKKKYLLRTQEFYERYGGKTIIIARFVPVVRTFAPFLAGVGIMSYPRFALYNVTGAVLWVTAMTLSGYWFGELEFVRKNFSIVVLVVVLLSIMPAVFEWYRAKRAAPV